ncbi:MAG: hypothetical protein ACKOEO_14900 [Planctomycetaceae bacterium]
MGHMRCNPAWMLRLAAIVLKVRSVTIAGFIGTAGSPRNSGPLSGAHP